MLFIKTDNSLFLEKVAKILNEGMSEWLERNMEISFLRNQSSCLMLKKGLSARKL